MADAYVEEVLRWRQEKDAHFRADPHSPIPPEARASFRGLPYFPPDPAYRVRARWEPLAAPKALRMQTSTGEARDYLAPGRLVFRLGGQEVTLLGLVSAEGHAHELFVPFRDKTSGKETYGAGRYLEVPMPTGAEAVVDFNLAYSPTCAYDDAYSCPLPPMENWLQVPVPAGEKTYAKP